MLVFGGGYDIAQDNVGYDTDDTGNRLFMVDAINGNVLWHAGPTNTTGLGHDSTANFFHPKLTTSIPADIRVIDMTGDGFADRMYTADTGGRVWRFDINNGKSAGTGNGSAPFGSTGTNALVTGGPLASLGFADAAGTSPADARKFYVAPDASLGDHHQQPHVRQPGHRVRHARLAEEHAGQRSSLQPPRPLAVRSDDSDAVQRLHGDQRRGTCRTSRPR